MLPAAPVTATRIGFFAMLLLHLELLRRVRSPGAARAAMPQARGKRLGGRARACSACGMFEIDPAFLATSKAAGRPGAVPCAPAVRRPLPLDRADPARSPAPANSRTWRRASATS